MSWHPHPLSRTAGALSILAACAMPAAAAKTTPSDSSLNPITRIARFFSPKLVEIEDRLDFLNQRISTLSQFGDCLLQSGLGYRGYRPSENAPDPSIILDLGHSIPIETIYLIPAQKESLHDTGTFPKRFTLDLSDQPDFKQHVVVYSSGKTPFPSPNQIPVSFKTKHSARYVRMTVQEGHNKGVRDLFSLTEFMIFSDGEPVSFNADITTTGSMEVKGIWYPQALIDGRTTHGIWQHGNVPETNSSDCVHLKQDDETTSWALNLDTTSPVDRIVLFPYLLPHSAGETILPEAMEIRFSTGGDASTDKVYQWENPLPGVYQPTPLVIATKGTPAKSITLTATRPWKAGERKIHALSEIEVWSGGRNIALNHTITRHHSGETQTVSTLTDGFASEKQIAPIAVWLQQLTRRERIEEEINFLMPLRNQMASESELNATWGVSVMLGLTFLIPVFIIERRRLISKQLVNRMRKRIASDLHDDIGSNLGSISLIARTARKDLVRMHGPETIGEDLDEVESIARESSLAMRDIVWLLERRQDSIGDLVTRIRETAGRMLREIHYNIECQSTKSASKLTLDAKRHLFLFYKEAIHNILKHSQATLVGIRLWDEDDKLALEITDNGIGLPPDAEKQQTAISKLHDRAEALSGELKIKSSKDTGTCISLRVKRAHLTKYQPQS